MRARRGGHADGALSARAQRSNLTADTTFQSHQLGEVRVERRE